MLNLTIERRTDHERRQRLDEMTTDQLIQLLTIDELTGLGNRRGLQELTSDGRTYVYAIVDVDSLKWVNDNWGHAAGDAMLQCVAHQLAVLDENESPTPQLSERRVFRTGGDEFTVAIPTDGSSNDEHAMLRMSLELIQATVAKCSFEWVDGANACWQSGGTGFSYGVGYTEAQADARLLVVKNQRTSMGLRAGRGERPSNLFAPIEVAE